jgi:hypothetical protein
MDHLKKKKKYFAKSPRVKTAIRWRSLKSIFKKDFPGIKTARSVIRFWANCLSSSTQVTLTRDLELSSESLGCKFINFYVKKFNQPGARIFDLRRRAEFVIEIKTAGIIANINKIKNNTKPPKWTK